MPDTTIVGGLPGLDGIKLHVGQTFNAAMVALRPLDYTHLGQVLGHYSVAQMSGATVSLGAGAHAASFRWPDPSRYAVMLKIRAGWMVTGAVTIATPMDLQAVIARGFTIDFTTNSTQLSLAASPKTNAMRSTMGGSLMGALGPRILTTAAMSGQTLTADIAPFGVATWVNQPSGNATVTQAVGVGGAITPIYECTAPGQHPAVLSNNEGIVIQPVTAGPVSGTIKYYVEWTWAEVALF